LLRRGDATRGDGERFRRSWGLERGRRKEMGCVMGRGAYWSDESMREMG
jgi:hypothetical protein